MFSGRTHHAGSSINDQVRAGNVRAESARQEADNSSNLYRKAKSLNTTSVLLLAFPVLSDINNL